MSHSDVRGQVPAARHADASALPPGLSRLSEHWGLVVGYGVLTLLVGLMLVLWPGRTLLVLAVFLAVQLIITGVYKIVTALGSTDADGGVRTMLVLHGGLSLVVGLLCLRSPLRTVVVIGLLIGAWCMMTGVIDVISAVFGRRENTLWAIVTGILSMVIGGFLLVDPGLSLTALVVVVAVWLFGYGGIAIVAGLRLRSLREAQSAGLTQPMTAS